MSEDRPASGAAASRKPTVRKPKAHVPVKETAPKAKATPEITHAEPVVAEVAVHKIPHGKSFYAVGRRKTAVSQILVTGGNGTFTINKLPFEGYFQTSDLQHIVNHPITSIGLDKQLNIKAKIHGGGIHAQAESMRHAISRALIQINPDSRRTLKKLGFLTRDPRVKERKKPGLKRARRAPQFSKR
ncbi:MAG: 30S ribosomal protein S9 [Candidatus Doudnabacteria bacterium]|nr:30S ribosomal protein S9 [Candidatus Doudnabacteria bacterium]